MALALMGAATSVRGQSVFRTPSPSGGEIVVSTVAGAPSPPSAPQPAGRPLLMTLDEAVALGLRQNRGVRSARLQRVVQRFDLTVAERAFTPDGGVSAELIRRHAQGGETSSDAVVSASVAWRSPLGTTAGLLWERRDPLGGGFGGATDIQSLQLRQPLLRGAGYAVNMAPVRIARLQEEVNRLRFEAGLAETVTAIVYAYRALIEAQEQGGLAELSLERTRALLDTNRALIEAGRMAAADIVQTESSVASQEVAVLEAHRRRGSAQVALLRLLALDPGVDVRADAPVDVRGTELDVEALKNLAFERRVDVLAQQIAILQIRQADVVARNNRLWDLSVVASASRRDGAGGGAAPGVETDHMIGLRLDVPIGDYATRQRALSATTALQTAELHYEDLVAAVETQVHDAVQMVDSSWRQLEAARRARDLALRALELQQEKLRVGRASNFEVLSFQAELRAAGVQELTARIAYLNALTALDQQIGSTLETWRISLDD